MPGSKLMKNLQIVTKAEIVQNIDHKKLFSALKNAFCDFEDGQYNIPPVGYLGFENPSGDFHIKYGHKTKDDVFVVKISSGFYDNPKLGLPSSMGMMLVFSAKTGEPLALLQDEGLLTDVRTAIAGALATQALALENQSMVGIIGCGIQARLQLQYLKSLTNIEQAIVWGRDQRALQQYAAEMKTKGINIIQAKSPEEVCHTARIIVTTTPATSPILKSDWIKPGTHITAVGADAEGKQELEEELVARADLVVADFPEQCINHGEICHAVKSGKLDRNKILSLGSIFKDPQLGRKTEKDITLVDLTGVAIQDIEIAKAVWSSVTQDS